MREVVTGLVDAVAPTGRADFVSDVCEPYPIPIICELLGAPKTDWQLFSRLAADVLRIFNFDLANDLDIIMAAQDELDAYTRELIAERRSKPADDLITALIAAEEAGDRLDTDELVMMVEAVIVGGTDTTRNQLGCAVALFADHPDQWALLAEQPELAGRAVEECMRYLGAVRGTGRFAVRGHRVPGRAVPAGHDDRAQPGVREPGRIGVPRSGHVRHHPRAGRPTAADLRRRHPLLPRRVAGPGRAAGGAADPRPPPAGSAHRRRDHVEADDRRHLGPGATADHVPPGAYGAGMKLGLTTGYWGSGPPAGALEAVKEADRLGFDSVWTAEAYGSDALDTAGVVGQPDRADQARHIDHADERPHTGGHGDGGDDARPSVRWPRASSVSARRVRRWSRAGTGSRTRSRSPAPASTSRSCAASFAATSRCRSPASSTRCRIPGGTGLGKPLKSTIHPFRTEIPIYLGAEGPKNVALAAELCDGWLPLFFAPKDDAWYRRCLEEGFAAAGEPGKADRFDVAATLMVVPGDDVEKCADMLRPMLALYAGGMGAKGQNFHFDVFARMGYEAEATKIQELYLAGRKAEAIAAVPLAHGRGHRARSAHPTRSGASCRSGARPA